MEKRTGRTDTTERTAQIFTRPNGPVRTDTHQTLLLMTSVDESAIIACVKNMGNNSPRANHTRIGLVLGMTCGENSLNALTELSLENNSPVPTGHHC